MPSKLLSDPFDDKFTDTMGKLIKQLDSLTHADSGLASDLVEALRLRNDLAHRFWRERSDEFCSDEGRAKDDRLPHQSPQALRGRRPAAD